jgi:hypothetical protein
MRLRLELALSLGARLAPALAAAGLVVLAVAVPSAALGADEHTEYVGWVELAKGHLTASRETYRKGQRVRADVHAAHPIQELGYRLWRPVTRVDAELARQVEAAVRQVSTAADGKTPSREYDALVARTLELLDRAVARVVPADVRDAPRFQAAVLNTILDSVVEEYDEGVAQGKVVLEIEYQDAWSFLQRARARWPALRERIARASPDVVAAVDTRLGELARAMPGITPPPAPVPADRVKGAVQAIADALGRIGDQRPQR